MVNATAVPSANARVVQIEIRQAAVVRSVLGMLENVANTPNGVDQRSWRVMVNLTAKTINMDVDDVGGGIDPHPPDVVQNHGASHHRTLSSAKKILQRKLLRSKLQQVHAPSCCATYEFELKICSL